ncbi:MAG TPA: TonB-dependent receptor, partial [Lacunisphaera sp.]|nr:TonB-dependent receptor [Lacunisphaera sp.]
MIHSLPSLLSRLRALAAGVFVLSLCALSASADATKKSFDLAAGDAAQTLKAYTQQSGVQIVYPVDQVRGVQTQAVKGEYAAREALDAMLTRTGLVAVQDERTGALAVRRDAGPNDQRAAQMEPSARPEKPARTSNGAIELEKYEVVGTRINGLANQTIVRTDEAGALAYDVINRVDIERLGVTSLEELFRVVTQTSDYGSQSLQGSALNPAFAGGATYQNSEVKLRGFSSLQTTILVNGRRLQRGNLTAGPDLNRIPVAAIDRIEILPSSASAIYGGGAIGGAINIILRRDYTGRDLTVSGGISTDGGAERYQLTYFEGRTFNGGRTRFSFTVDYQHSGPLYNSDRPYLDNLLARYPANTTALVSGRSAFEQYILQAFNGMPGTVLINSLTGTLPIPGTTGVRYAAIPANQDGSALTPASFVAGAGQANLGGRYNRSIIYRPEDRYAFTSQLEHEFVKDKLSMYAEAGVTYFRSEITFPMNLSSMSLSATDPL